jgi:hypothetical protein
MDTKEETVEIALAIATEVNTSTVEANAKYRAAVETLRETHSIQGNSGNWDYDYYMQGMFNGLELALACMEGRDPEFRAAPDKWLSASGIGKVINNPTDPQNL